HRRRPRLRAGQTGHPSVVRQGDDPGRARLRPRRGESRGAGVVLQVRRAAGREAHGRGAGRRLPAGGRLDGPRVAETMKRNLIFCAVGPGPGTVPFRKEPGATWDLVEVLWHPKMIQDHKEGRYKTDANIV